MSSRIVGFVLIAFLIFITLKGDLKGYLQVIGIIPGDNPAPKAVIGSGSGGTLGDVKQVASLAYDLSGFI